MSSGRARIAVAVIGAISLVVLGAAWSLASPIGASPDDDFHLATIWCHSGDPDLCRDTSGELEEGMRPVLVQPVLGPGIACYAFQPTVSASCQDEIAGSSELVRGRADDGSYPGGFHRFMSLFASDDVDRSAVAMRMVSWLLAVALLVAAAVLAEGDLRRAFSIAVLTTVVPLGLFLFASNNPSGLAVAGVAAYWCAAQAYLAESLRDRARTAAIVAVLVIAAGVALASRTDSAIFLAVASAAAWISAGGYRRALWRRSALLAGVCVVGALGLLLGRQVQLAAERLADERERSLGLVVFENVLELPRLLLGSLGFFGLGWLDTPQPALVGIVMALVLGGVLVAGLGATSRDKWLALAAVAIPLVAIPMIALAARRGLVGESNMQPRYLLPLLPLLVGTALLAPRGRPGVVLRSGQVALLAVGVVLAHTAALHANIRRYVTGIDVRGLDLGADLEWWWERGPGPMAVWLLGSTAFAAAVACALVLVGREARGPVADRP